MSKGAIRFKPEEVRTIAFGAIGAAYTAVGASMDNPIRIFFLQNWTDESLMFSFDGVNDHLPLPAGGFIVIDVTANKSLPEGFYIAEGDSIYVKEIGTPTTGSVYLSVFYGDNGY